MDHLVGCYHGENCLQCLCVQRFLRGEKHPCEHSNGRCIQGCKHIAEALKDPLVRERIDVARSIDLIVLWDWMNDVALEMRWMEFVNGRGTQPSS